MKKKHLQPLTPAALYARVSESASVLDFVKSSPPDLTKSRTFTLRFVLDL